MTGSLINREVLPFVLALAALAAAALLLDLALHLADAVWIGRYLGIPGTALILLSLERAAPQPQCDVRIQTASGMSCYIVKEYRK